MRLILPTLCVQYSVHIVVCSSVCHEKAIKWCSSRARMEYTGITGISSSRPFADHLSAGIADAMTNKKKSAAAGEDVLHFARHCLMHFFCVMCICHFIVPHPGSHLLPDYVLVDVGREQRGRGQQSRVHGGHDGGSHSSDANDGHVRWGEKLQGNGEDGTRLATIIRGRQAVAGGVPVWQGRRNVGMRRQL